MDQDFSEFRPSRLWKRLPPERRIDAAELFWTDEQSTEQQIEAVARDRRAHEVPHQERASGCRPTGRRSIWRRCRAMSDTIAARALVNYHLEHQRPMMGAFLDCARHRARGRADQRRERHRSRTPRSCGPPRRSSPAKYPGRGCGALLLHARLAGSRDLGRAGDRAAADRGVRAAVEGGASRPRPAVRFRSRRSCIPCHSTLVCSPANDQPAGRTREPVAQARIERRVEIRVAAARPGIVFPAGVPHRDQRSRRSRASSDAATMPSGPSCGDDLPAFGGGAAAGEQPQDPGAAPLCSLPSQTAPVGRSRSERPVPARAAPERPLELQQHPRRGAVREAW